jgi:hypothetical protein
MKKIFYLVTIVLLFSSIFYAQERRHKRMDGHKKIEQLERLKLMEILDLDEETFIRFFARHSEHKMKVRQSLEEQDKKLEDMEAYFKSAKMVTDKEYQSLSESFIAGERKMLEARFTYMQSLQTILTPEQICKLIVFEKRFRDEIRDFLIKDRRRVKLDKDR